MPATIPLNQAQADDIVSRNRQAAAQVVAAARQGILPPHGFVFFAAFDGTNNTQHNEPAVNTQTTNVAQLWQQYRVSDRCGGAYFAGPGAPGTLNASSWLSPKVTRQITQTAELAYAKFTHQARVWFATGRPTADVAIVLTGFSRGVISAAVFSRLLHERGLTDDNGRQLIAPRTITITAGVLFDPVATGVNCSITFAPGASNVVHLFALNEYRHLYKAPKYRGVHGITTVDFVGCHCDVGGGYDNGLGALSLQAATTYFQRCGLPMDDVPVHRHFAMPAADALVHSEGVYNEPPDANRPWDAYRNFEASQADFSPTTRLPWLG